MAGICQILRNSWVIADVAIFEDTDVGQVAKKKEEAGYGDICDAQFGNDTREQGKTFARHIVHRKHRKILSVSWNDD